MSVWTERVVDGLVRAQRVCDGYVLDVIEYEYGVGRRASRDYGWRVFCRSDLDGKYVREGAKAIVSGFAMTIDLAKKSAESAFECLKGGEG